MKTKVQIEIKKVQTSEVNVGDRTITYDIYVDGKYEKTVRDILDALDFKAAATNYTGSVLDLRSSI
jgi:hypothetical protein